MSYCYDYPRPAITVDVALVRSVGRRLELLLIRRRDEPFAGHWAIPGGFVDIDEEIEVAARRELVEETDVRLSGPLREIGAFGKVGRDPRGRTISIAFLALCRGGGPTATAGDDAADVGWFDLASPPRRVAFDHRVVIRRARETLQRAAAEREPAAFELLPRRFTLVRLREVYEAIAGRALDAASFRRKMQRLGVLERVAGRAPAGGGRAALYSLRKSRWRALPPAKRIVV